MDDLKIFDEKYNEYLPLIKEFPFSEKADILGIQKRNNSFVFGFFNHHIAFDQTDFMDVSGGEVSSAVKVVLCKYLLMCPEKIVETSNRLVTFQDFPGFASLSSSLTASTCNIIETTFSGHLETLKERCLRLGGTIMETKSYDLSVRFRALHRVPIILNFNDMNSKTPARTVFLYHDNADVYLDSKSLTLVCRYLTGLLIQPEDV